MNTIEDNNTENQGDFVLLIPYLKSINETMDRIDIIRILKSCKLEFPFNHNSIPQFSDVRIRNVTENLLLQSNQFETEETRINKDKVLKSLQDIITEWSISIAEKEKQIYREQLRRCAAVLLPYGSFLLGVTGQESDMDLVCVAPNFIERKNHFFDGLYEILKKDPNVTKINKIEISYNPIIKLDYSSFQVDINFAQINRDTIPQNIDEELDELRRTILNNDRQSIDALNGRQNGLMIKNSVPNEKQFIETLRIIKLWSKKRCVSGNIVGYLGGISWAILVAKICKLFPNLNAHQTVYMFFKIYHLWDWNVEIEIEQEQNMNTFKECSWPQNVKNGKRDELMKIITPAIPCINSAAKVNFLTFKAIGKEISRGLDILSEQEVDEIHKWEKLMSPFELLNEFKFYLNVSIVSNNPNEFHKWAGFCEAQLVSLQENIGDYLYYGNMKKQYGTNDEPIINYSNNLDHDKFNVYIQNRYEIRISSSGFNNFELDFKSSYTYLIGIKKLDLNYGPIFLIVPVAHFAEKILKNKVRQNFTPVDNMKIYFSNRKQYFQKLQEVKRKDSSEVEAEVKKKIKLDTSHLDLIRNISQEPLQFDNAAMNSILEDMF